LTAYSGPEAAASDGIQDVREELLEKKSPRRGILGDDG